MPAKEDGVAYPVNLLLRINLHERVPHPAFFWRGGAFRFENSRVLNPPFVKTTRPP
jgi:hypothetical protein